MRRCAPATRRAEASCLARPRPPRRSPRCPHGRWRNWPASLRRCRWSLNFAETGFDPAQMSDLYSNGVIRNIFEAPLQYDYLARPVQLMPRTAADNAGHRRTVTGPSPYACARASTSRTTRPSRASARELVAADYVYQLKRVVRSALEEPALRSTIEQRKLLGLAERCASEAQKTGQFDYDRRSTASACWIATRSRCRLGRAELRASIDNLTDANGSSVRSRARLSKSYPDEIRASRSAPGRSVWQTGGAPHASSSNAARRFARSSTRHAGSRRRPQGSEAAQLKGRKLPLVDRVEISIIDESQPRWLSFLNGAAGPSTSPARVHQCGRAQRQARAGAGEARYPVAPDAELRTSSSPTSTWRIRWSAAIRPRRWRCAARSASAYDPKRRDPHDPARARGARTVAGAALTCGLRRHLHQRHGRVRPGARQRAARHLRLRRSRRRRLARTARRLAAASGDRHPESSQIDARIQRDVEASSSTRSAYALRSTSTSGPRTPRAHARGKLMMWALGWSADGLGRRLVPGASATVHDIGAAATTRASSVPSLRRVVPRCSASCRTARSGRPPFTR